MPDLRDKQQSKARSRRKLKTPGNNNELPNNETVESRDLPGDVARDISNEGVAFDPRDKQPRLNP